MAKYIRGGLKVTNFEFAFNVIRDYANIEEAFKNTENPEKAKDVFWDVVNKRFANDMVKFLFIGHSKEEWIDTHCITNGKGKIILKNSQRIDENYPYLEGVIGKIDKRRYSVNNFFDVRCYDNIKLQAIEYGDD